jgi:hypothetical protein
MKKPVVLLCLSFCLLSTAAFAGPQQEKMKTCNKEAKTKSLKGDERKAFMKTCLRGKEAPAASKKATVDRKE